MNVDTDAGLIRSVRHRHRNDDRHFQINQLLHQEQALVEVRCIQHRKDTVGYSRARHATENDVDGYVLFKRMRAERMRAGQIDQFGRGLPVFQQPNVPLDRDPGIVANPLFKTRQPVE